MERQSEAVLAPEAAVSQVSRRQASRARPDSRHVEAQEPARLAVVVARWAAARLRESEARFRALAESIPQLAWTTLPDGRVEFLNARWWEFTGADPDTAGDVLWRRVTHPEDLPRAMEAWRRALAQGTRIEMWRSG